MTFDLGTAKSSSGGEDSECMDNLRESRLSRGDLTVGRGNPEFTRVGEVSVEPDETSESGSEGWSVSTDERCNASIG